MKVQKRFELAQKKYGNNISPEMLCPRWDRCACNRCILNPTPKQKIDISDPQRKCKLPKIIRKEIGTYFKLKNKGLTSREISGAKLWDNLSPEEKERRTTKLKEISLFHKLSKKGYAVSRVKTKKSSFTHNKILKTPKNTISQPNIENEDEN